MMRDTARRDRYYSNDPEMANAINDRNEKVLKEILQRDDFDSFVNDAYKNPEGYTIRMNPVTGEKEMFIAGTRNMGDWGSNVIESVNALILDNPILRHEYNEYVEENAYLPGALKERAFSRATGWRVRASRKYSEIAEREGVKVVYGHSRGGAIVADMDTKATKVGLDSATVIADNKDMLNIRERRWFDHIIGVGSKQSLVWDKGNTFHHVWD